MAEPIPIRSRMQQVDFNEVVERLDPTVREKLKDRFGAPLGRLGLRLVGFQWSTEETIDRDIQAYDEHLAEYQQGVDVVERAERNALQNDIVIR